jgi:DNA polymerase-4
MFQQTATILHVDMDAFYASVEQRDRPELRGRPVIVGGSSESRGVVCAASYEARQYGVHSAMPSSRAHRLCPQGIFLPIRMNHYVQIARQIREIFQSYTPLVEPLSLDEAFLDVRGCESLFGRASEIAVQLKARILREIDLVASVGVASNKFLAKLASDLSKPDGLLLVDPSSVTAFLDPLPVERIWGVGKKGAKRMHDLGLFTIGQLARSPVQILIDHFGESGRHFSDLAQGHDARTVVPDREAKSISTETTFPRDLGDRSILRSVLLDLVDQVARRLRDQRMRGRTVEVKARTASFQTYIRSVTLAESTDITEIIWQAARELFDQRIRQDWLPLRLLGVGVSGLTARAPSEANLFHEEWQKQHSRTHSAGESLCERDQELGDDYWPFTNLLGLPLFLAKDRQRFHDSSPDVTCKLNSRASESSL